MHFEYVFSRYETAVKKKNTLFESIHPNFLLFRIMQIFSINSFFEQNMAKILEKSASLTTVVGTLVDPSSRMIFLKKT